MLRFAKTGKGCTRIEASAEPQICRDAERRNSTPLGTGEHTPLSFRALLQRGIPASIRAGRKPRHCCVHASSLPQPPVRPFVNPLASPAMAPALLRKLYPACSLVENRGMVVRTNALCKHESSTRRKKVIGLIHRACCRLTIRE
jgi:hypothetical protein